MLRIQFFLECAARLVRARRVNSRSTLLDVADDSLFVYDEGGAAADEARLVEDAIGLDHLALDVAEQRECHSDVFLEPLVGSKTVNADTYDLSIRLLEFGYISLIRLQLFRSTSGEGEHIESKRDVLLAAEVRELDRVAVRVGEREIGRHVADLQVRLRRARLLRGCAAVTVIRN
jgi:hypothetical protein